MPFYEFTLSGDLDPGVVEQETGLRCTLASRGCGPVASWSTGRPSTGRSNGCTGSGSISSPSNGVRHVTHRDEYVRFPRIRCRGSSYG